MLLEKKKLTFLASKTGAQATSQDTLDKNESIWTKLKSINIDQDDEN